jgi:hypothetical protein
MTFDWTVSLGNILTLLTMVVAMLTAYIAIRVEVSVMKLEIVYLAEAVKNISSILTSIAVQDVTLESYGKRLDRMEKDIDLLRQGEGFIFPLDKHLFPPNTKK